LPHGAQNPKPEQALSGLRAAPANVGREMIKQGAEGAAPRNMKSNMDSALWGAAPDKKPQFSRVTTTRRASIKTPILLQIRSQHPGHFFVLNQYAR